MPDHSKTAVFLAVFLTATAFATPSSARPTTSSRPEALLPLERQVRDQFPSVALDSQSTLESSQELVAGQMVSGMRARPPRRARSAHSSLQPIALYCRMLTKAHPPALCESSIQRPTTKPSLSSWVNSG